MGWRDNEPKTKTVLHSHAKKRVKQRYGLEFNRFDFRNLIEAVQHKRAQRLFGQSISKIVYKYNYKEKDLVFIYDNVRCAIVTFLPPITGDLTEYIEEQKQRFYEHALRKSCGFKYSLEDSIKIVDGNI